MTCKFFGMKQTSLIENKAKVLMSKEETIIDCKTLAGTLLIAAIICGSLTFGLIKVSFKLPRQHLDGF